MKNKHLSIPWLDAAGMFTVKLGLKRPRKLMEYLGFQGMNLKFIHVAGSNGKGSVCSFIENALRKHGYKTAFYSSPHLIEVNERYRINGVPVSDSVLLEAAEKVHAADLQMQEQDGMQASYFELSTAIAFLIFAKEKPDFVVWETGMGGRMDATNLVTPIIEIITGISLEHTAYLGRTPAAIAAEKAGIIKEGTPLIFKADIDSAAYSVIAGRAVGMNAEYTAVKSYDGPRARVLSDNGVPYQEIELDGHKARLSLFGRHQRDNAKIAFEAAKKLGLDTDLTLQAFSETVWPARFQVIPEKRLIIDGAHNPEGAEACSAALGEFLDGEKAHFISGCFADKNSHDMIPFFAPHAEDFAFIQFNGDGRTVSSADSLGALLHGIAAWQMMPLEDALKNLPAQDGKWTVLTGSLHLCGEALDLLNSQE